LIDFEGPPTGATSGLDYLSQGIRFSGSAGVQEVNYGGAISEIITSGDWFSPLEMTFVDPGDSSVDATTDYVAMQNHWGPGGPGGGTDEWTASSYDINGVLIETKTLIGDGWLIFDTGAIHVLVLDDMNSTAFAMDNLTYNPPTTGGGNYCASTPNSTGVAAVISYSGSTSLADNNLTLYAAPVPNKPGIFFFGPNQIEIPFGNGFLCVGGGLTRLNPPVVASGNLATYVVDVVAAGLIVGTTNFQYWGRDPAGGGAFFNTSNGLSITFIP